MKSIRPPFRLASLVLLAGALPLMGMSVQSEPRGELAYVARDQVPLLSLPLEEGVPQLGQLLRGTALTVQERRGEFSRISLQAWVKTEDLAAEAAVAADLPAVHKPPQPPPVGEPVDGLHRAVQIDVEVEALAPGKDRGAGLRFILGLRASKNRPVHFQGEQGLLLSLFTEQRIAGGRVRGPVLLRRNVVLQSPKTEVWIDRKDLPESLPEQIRATAQLAVTERQMIFGTASLELQAGVFERTAALEGNPPRK